MKERYVLKCMAAVAMFGTAIAWVISGDNRYLYIACANAVAGALV